MVVIVTGSVEARVDSFDRVLELSLAHVRRSRAEPGCVLHSVLRDVEQPLRLLFLEQWADADALHAHFRVPASGAFVAQLAALAATPPEMAIFNAQPTSP